jgi:hypothetical protein
MGASIVNQRGWRTTRRAISETGVRPHRRVRCCGAAQYVWIIKCHGDGSATCRTAAYSTTNQLYQRLLQRQ